MTVSHLIKFIMIFFAIFTIIFVITILTPKMASVTDKIIAKLFKGNPERVDDDIYKVRSIYDAQPNNNNDAETSADSTVFNTENGKK